MSTGSWSTLSFILEILCWRSLHECAYVGTFLRDFSKRELGSSYSKNYVLEVLDPRLNFYLKISSGILYTNVRMIWKLSAGARASFLQPCRKLNPTGSYSTSI